MTDLTSPPRPTSLNVFFIQALELMSCLIILSKYDKGGNLLLRPLISVNRFRGREDLSDKNQLQR